MVPLVDAADLVAASGRAPRPDAVLRIGESPTAKSVRLWWEGLGEVPQVLVDPYQLSHDPSHAATILTDATPSSLLAAVGTPDSVPHSWADEWTELGKIARRAADGVLESWSGLTEAHLARVLVETLTTTTTLVASSSMPIRDLDSFGSADSGVDIVANRGINGIDGVVSTAIGVARARPGDDIVVLIGDVALLHDIGGVLDAARQGCSMTIVVPHNDGGGIFSFLPIRDTLDDSTYSELFHTPHGTDFSFLSGYPGISYQEIDSDSLRSAVVAARERDGISLLVAPIDTADNVAAHRAVQATVDRSVRR